MGPLRYIDERLYIPQGGRYGAVLQLGLRLRLPRGRLRLLVPDVRPAGGRASSRLSAYCLLVRQRPARNHAWRGVVLRAQVCGRSRVARGADRRRHGARSMPARGRPRRSPRREARAHAPVPRAATANGQDLPRARALDRRRPGRAARRLEGHGSPRASRLPDDRAGATGSTAASPSTSRTRSATSRRTSAAGRTEPALRRHRPASTRPRPRSRPGGSRRATSSPRPCARRSSAATRSGSPERAATARA